MSSRSQPRHATRYMLSWLSDTCRTAREEAGLTREQVAVAGNFSYFKIYRFEEEANRWPQGFDGIDRLLAAYAAALGLGDHRELWLRAINDWFGHHERSITLERGEFIESEDGETPRDVLSAVEQAVEAYAREREQEAPPAEAAARETKRRAAAG